MPIYIINQCICALPYKTFTYIETRHATSLQWMMMGKMMGGFVCWMGNNLYIRELFTKPVIMNDREMFRNFRVKSARASWHDYGNGIYFVTVCTAHRIHYFGRINNQEMELSALGQFLSYQLEHVSEHYPYAQIPFFVVMPDHFHGIVLIDGDLAPSLKRKECVMDDLCEDKSQLARLQGWLSVVIGGIKSAVTKYARIDQPGFAWQTRFHDRIIRDEKELEHIYHYIEANAMRWEK